MRGQELNESQLRQQTHAQWVGDEASEFRKKHERKALKQKIENLTAAAINSPFGPDATRDRLRAVAPRATLDLTPLLDGASPLQLQVDTHQPSINRVNVVGESFVSPRHPAGERRELLNTHD